MERVPKEAHEIFLACSIHRCQVFLPINLTAVRIYIPESALIVHDYHYHQTMLNKNNFFKCEQTMIQL
jgi:hypothetical protein